MTAGGDQTNVADITQAQNASNLRPMFRLLQVAAGTSVPDNANTLITWDTEDYDYGGQHAAGASAAVLTKAGVWYFKAALFFPSATDYLTLGAVIAKNGVNQPPWQRIGPNAIGAQRTVDVDCQILCAAGDSITVIGYQDNTANTARTTVFGSSFECVFEGKFVRDA